MSSTASKHKPQLICNCIVLRGQPSPTILYTDSLPLPYFTQTAFPYHTLHRQPSPTILYTDSLPLPYFTQTAYPDNRHSPDCVLHCVGRLAIVSRNSLRCDWCFARAHVCHSYFVLECPKHWNTRGVLTLLSE